MDEIQGLVYTKASVLPWRHTTEPQHRATPPNHTIESHHGATPQSCQGNVCGASEPKSFRLLYLGLFAVFVFFITEEKVQDLGHMTKAIYQQATALAQHTFQTLFS